jgi:hypothetical protein
MSNQGSWKLTPLTPCSVKRVVRELDEAFSRANPDHKRVKSPAEQFDDSHAEWVKNGREC